MAAEIARTQLPRQLPLALRTAPAPLQPDASLDELLNTLVAPVRSGMILTFADLTECATAIGAGIRRGERRYALQFLLQQHAHATLNHLAAHTLQWSQRHATCHDKTSLWWARRAHHTAQVLTRLADHRRRADAIARRP